ncbi:50S ribosomal protein L1 [Candidatus Falkowbacteria bacterium HGW-Falkowbacteria-1]|uniref:Ribosomal protein n=1 Tax=Candidatus Falkowbacteria bacterium HGW-Falkowbacteria-1 TaxID=2013768 RepID=A0A2N2E9G5_9BACT|nr:MAG: 50S ribosomal protein L1 [Candidatus Falkowbacteria bacterium HGW-Falkowbacteria-1]
MENLEKGKTYSITEAIDFCKKNHKVKFDASVEVHFKLGIDTKKGDQQVRSAVSLPNGTGKTVIIAAFVSPEKEKAVKEAGADLVGGDDLIEEIKKTEKTNFDIAIAETSMMKNLAKIAKILGTRGLMPSPKNDTVTNDPIKATKELKKGKISFKSDDTGNVHAIIGKVSFENKALEENFNTLLDAIKKAKPSSSKGVYIRNTSINSTMGKGIKISV